MAILGFLALTAIAVLWVVLGTRSMFITPLGLRLNGADKEFVSEFKHRFPIGLTTMRVMMRWLNRQPHSDRNIWTTQILTGGHLHFILSAIQYSPMDLALSKARSDIMRKIRNTGKWRIFRRTSLHERLRVLGG
jgi:hypothetical protein